MNRLRLDPLQDLHSFFNIYSHPERTNQSTTKTDRDWSPKVDVLEEESRFLIVAELAGIDKQDIKIELQENILSLSGERKLQLDDKKALRVERGFGKFKRSFSLPENIDETNISAQSKNGLLVLSLPKLVKEKSLKNIEIH
ncbi:Hsp20/alpha crystallin family protein [Aliikangiella sp. IMCC44653]